MNKHHSKSKRRLTFLSLTFLVLLGLVVFSVFGDWVTIFKNKNQQIQLLEKYDNLLEDEEKLEGELNKLQDPEYVTRYIREKYLYSKDGEYIIRIPEAEE